MQAQDRSDEIDDGTVEGMVEAQAQQEEVEARVQEGEEK